MVCEAGYHESITKILGHVVGARLGFNGIQPGSKIRPGKPSLSETRASTRPDNPVPPKHTFVSLLASWRLRRLISRRFWVSTELLGLFFQAVGGYLSTMVVCPALLRPIKDHRLRLKYGMQEGLIGCKSINSPR
jgi:hypothetical protein